MLVKLSRWLLVVALSLSIGAHWVVLQSVAWVGMAVSYSQDSSLKEALVKTFDGMHPCKLCKFVAEGKKSEKKHEVQKVETKLDLCCPGKPMFIISPPVASFQSRACVLLAARIDPPPTPPPRSLLG